VGTWNYRVIELVTPLNDPSGSIDMFRAIHEVHYDDDGCPVGYSATPATVGWDLSEGEDAPIAILDRMREALVKPVLTDRDFHRDLAALGSRFIENIKRSLLEVEAGKVVPYQFDTTEFIASTGELKNHPTAAPAHPMKTWMDKHRLNAKLAGIVEVCAEKYADEDYPLDPEYRPLAINVQSALRQLGHDVSIAHAAAVWECHSATLCAGWMLGAETVDGAIVALVSYA
jgi:hypothetical protein